MLVFATMQVISGRIWIAPGIKNVAQIIAGCFIGASLSMNDLRRLPRLWKAFTIIVIGLIILNITIGLIIASVSNLSVVTALFAAIPGGMSTIPIISVDYGADPILVTVLQFMRMVMGIGVFPSLVVNLSKKFKSEPTRHIYTDEIEIIAEDSIEKSKALNPLVGVLLAAVLSLMIMQFLPAFNLMVVALMIMTVINLTIGV
ncbi:AbrB family transcriptional regulator [Aerococcaceae bacterium WGS1372]